MLIPGIPRASTRLRSLGAQPRDQAAPAQPWASGVSPRTLTDAFEQVLGHGFGGGGRGRLDKGWRGICQQPRWIQGSRGAAEESAGNYRGHLRTRSDCHQARRQQLRLISPHSAEACPVNMSLCQTNEMSLRVLGNKLFCSESTRAGRERRALPAPHRARLGLHGSFKKLPSLRGRQKK